MADSTALAVLHVDGFVERDVVDYNFSFAQAIDKDNRPVGISRGSTLYVKVVANRNEENIELLQWAKEKAMKKDGYIQLFVPGEDNKDLTKIEFKEGYCIEYNQVWGDKIAASDARSFGHSDTFYYEEIWITWKQFKQGGVEYVNDWK
jgi:hypothetical protein